MTFMLCILCKEISDFAYESPDQMKFQQNKEKLEFMAINGVGMGFLLFAYVCIATNKLLSPK